MVDVLVEDPGSSVGKSARRISAPAARIWAAAAVSGVVVLLIALQIAASGQGFEGPLASLWKDYAGTPKSMSVPWAGLVLALVGLSAKRRVVALSAAVVIDLIGAGARLLAGDPPTVGNGAVIVLTAIAVTACVRWSGVERRNALGAAALGALLILATKVGDVWLHVTVVTRPEVFDQYVMLADHALGDPSWLMGRVVDALGPGVYAVLHWVYIELPVAAIVVAVWQLRQVVPTGQWPTHYLVRTFLVLGLLGPIVYLLFPVVGPMFAFGADGHGLQLGNYWPNVVPPIDRNPSALPFDTVTPRNCMPSMHTAWALSVFLHTRRDIDGGRAPAWLRWGGAFWLIATLTATLGFGYHYGVDLVAGAILCLTVESVLREPERGWGWFRVRLVGAGVAVLATLLLSYRYLSVPMAEYPALAGTIILALLAGFAAAFHATWFATHRDAIPARISPEPVG
ncbi:phosphatase PAP2 family protein [Nocardia aurea]|uniref:DUF5933 domain-containing protein n=1 Tax=Nocardia aurea TaxID=2144174 RepID=A0ABV3G1C4_9NOCA